MASSEPDKKTAAPTPGDLLRSAREAQDYSRREMADRLNWMHEFVEAVEENRFEELRGMTFVSGYLRTYARLLGIPEEEVLDALKNMTGMHSDESRLGETRLPQVQKHGFGVPVGVAAALLLVIAMWWLGAVEDPTEPASVEVAGASTEVETPAMASVPSAPPKSADIEPANEPAIEPAEIADAEQPAFRPVEIETAPRETPPEQEDLPVPVAALLERQGLETAPAPVDSAPTPASAESALAFETAPAGDEETLLFHFSKDCWLEVRDGSSDLIYADLRHAGDVLNVNGAAPFKILVGDASAVELSFRDEPVNIPVRPGRTTARFTVGEP